MDHLKVKIGRIKRQITFHKLAVEECHKEILNLTSAIAALTARVQDINSKLMEPLNTIEFSGLDYKRREINKKITVLRYKLDSATKVYQNSQYKVEKATKELKEI